MMATKKRLIDASVLTELMDVEYRRKMKLVRNGNPHLDTLSEGIMSMSVLLGTMPTVDAVEVVHGRWIEKQEAIPWCEDDVEVYTVCSVCECYSPGESNYCPNCGAKMDGERKDNA